MSFSPEADPDTSQRFTERVLTLADAIPPGRVMTYGDIAAELGTRAARAVGRVLAHYGSEVAWWRVVPATGTPPRGHEHRALEQYRAEGTPLILPHADAAKTGSSVRIDLNRARWRPS